MSGRILLYGILAALLFTGCAAPPRQALEGARKAVAEAYAGEAFRLAPDEFKTASEALSEGERLVRQGRFSRAREALSLAESQARRAELKTREERARMVAEERRLLQARLKQASPPNPPPPVPPPPKVSKPEPPPSPPPKPSPEHPPEPSPEPVPEPVIHYSVSNGETLWNIAAHGEIYRDALLWPLIYKANRDQIKDPRQIYPGQVLNIPRDISTSEKEEARETARESTIFPLELLIENRRKEKR